MESADFSAEEQAPMVEQEPETKTMQKPKADAAAETTKTEPTAFSKPQDSSPIEISDFWTLGKQKPFRQGVFHISGEKHFVPDYSGKCELCKKPIVPLTHAVILENYAIMKRDICEKCFNNKASKLNSDTENK